MSASTSSADLSQKEHCASFMTVSHPLAQLTRRSPGHRPPKCHFDLQHRPPAKQTRIPVQIPQAAWQHRSPPYPPRGLPCDSPAFSPPLSSPHSSLPQHGAPRATPRPSRWSAIPSPAKLLHLPGTPTTSMAIPSRHPAPANTSGSRAPAIPSRTRSNSERPCSARTKNCHFIPLRSLHWK
jgi:hypothetical protein